MDIFNHLKMLSILRQYSDCFHGYALKVVKLYACFLRFMQTEYHLKINIKGDGNPDDYYGLYERL